MRTIHVVCAIIEDKNKILVAQRGAKMNLPFKWEFPGGKINFGESKKESLVREIKEELDVIISVGRELRSSYYVDDELSINLIPFICRILFGEPRAVEHIELRWCDKGDCERLDWCPADIKILNEYWRLRSNRTYDV